MIHLTRVDGRPLSVNIDHVVAVFPDPEVGTRTILSLNVVTTGLHGISEVEQVTTPADYGAVLGRISAARAARRGA